VRLVRSVVLPTLFDPGRVFAQDVGSRQNRRCLMKPLLVKKVLLFSALVPVALVAFVGCKPKPKDISSLQRKEAAQHVSEAQFALTLRDYARAEDELAKAAKACPDNGDYWMNLGSVRMHLGQRDGAKAAYKSALSAFEDAAALAPKDVQSVLKQISVLALLGRTDDARALVGKLQDRFPDDRDARVFVEQKQLDHLLADPGFKEAAL